MKDPESPSLDTRSTERANAYWKKNVRVLIILLGVWFAVSLGAGVLFVDALDKITIPGTGYKLGFWFAQQGSIFVFVGIIAVYVRIMTKMDREFGVDEEEK